MKVVRSDKGNGRAPTFLLKFESGATYPAHDHPAGEEVFVLEGEVTFGKHHLKAGDYCTLHPVESIAVWTKQGCVMLLCVPEEVVILKKADTASPSSFKQFLQLSTGRCMTVKMGNHRCPAFSDLSEQRVGENWSSARQDSR